MNGLDIFICMKKTSKQKKSWYARQSVEEKEEFLSKIRKKRAERTPEQKQIDSEKRAKKYASAMPKQVKKRKASRKTSYLARTPEQTESSKLSKHNSRKRKQAEWAALPEEQKIKKRAERQAKEKAKQQQYYQKKKAAGKLPRQQNPGRYLEFSRRQEVLNIDKRRNQRYLKKYGITLNQFNEMPEQQNNVCAICALPETRKASNHYIKKSKLSKIQTLAVDHDHKTGACRGLLCDSCNLGIGLFDDNILLLKSSIKYLNKSNQINFKEAENAPKCTPKTKHYYKSKYGINYKQFYQLLIEQNNLCAICCKPENRVVRGKLAVLCVDHNHKTKEVRGLLCSKCNFSIGKFKEDPDLLQRVINYLLKYQEPNACDA